MRAGRENAITIQSKLLCFIAAFLVLLMLCGCAENAEKNTDVGSDDAEGVYTSFSQIEDKRIGVTTGSVQSMQAEERFPNATLFYFSNSADMLNALKSGKVDAFADADTLVKYMMIEDSSLTYIDEPLADGMIVAGIFPKTDEGQRLCDEYNAFIEELKASGEYDEIVDAWIEGDESKQVVPDFEGLPATNGKLDLAADLTMVPFAFVKGNGPVGMDMDIAYRFALERGYAIELHNIEFGGIIPAIISGKCDFAAGGFVYTEERAESVLFSEPTYNGGSVVAVLKKDAAGGGGFLASLAESFEKTFLREGR